MPKLIDYVPKVVRDSYLKKFATIVAVVIILTAGAGVFFQAQVSAELTHEKHAELRTVAELEAEELSEWVHAREENVRMLSNYETVRSGDTGAVKHALQAELESLPETVHAIHYVDLGSKTIVESTNDAQVGQDLPELEWSHGSLVFESSSEVAVSEGYKQGDTELIAFVSPVEGSDMAIMLTTDASARAEHFKAPVEGTYTQVVDSHGVVEFAQRQEHALQSYEFGTDMPAYQAAQNGHSGVHELDEEGLVVAYAPVEGTDWALLAHAPKSNAYVLARDVTRDFIVLVGISLGGFLLIGLTLGRNTVSTLNRLTENATTIAKGELDQEIEESDRDDELGELQAAFRSMQDYLRTVADQAEALADQRFDAAVLEEDVPGTFGETIDRMGRDIEQAQRELEDLNRSLEAKANDFKDVMEAAAAGDLRQRMDPESRNEAMTEIAVAFNDMMDELEETITRIREFADEVSSSSQDITSSTEEVEQASEQVSTSIQEISAGADQQSQQLQEVATEMQNLSGTVEEIAASADDVATTAQTAAELGATGKDSASEALDEMQAIETKADATVDEVEALAEEISEIGEVVDMITEIADQTNMLALNASVEAARAGDAGEGFAVVADEIKTLAEETADKTEQIEALVADIRQSTDDTVEDMQAMGERVAGGTATVEEALTALDEIAEHAEQANHGIQEINEATDEQASSTEEVVSMVDDVTSVAEQASSEAENVSAASEEQTSSLNEVSNSIQGLSQRAADLRELLAEFTVGDGDREPGTTGPNVEPSRQAAADGGRRPSMGSDDSQEP